MKTFNFFLCLFILLTVSITSCTDKEVPSPSTSTLPGAPATDEAVQYREEDPLVIRGHVKNTNGSAISGATVDLVTSSQNTLVRSTTTGTDGQYIMSGLDSNNYSLKISATGYAGKIVGIILTTNIERTDTLVVE